MDILLIVVGVAIIITVLLDAFETVVLPRRIVSPLRLTRLFYYVTWTPWAAISRRIRVERRREGFLGIYGPVSLLLLLGVWAISLIVGFALLHKAAEPDHMISMWHYLYYSGTTFFTLGLGDVVPTTSIDRVVTIIESGLGFSFLGLVIGYLPLLYQSFSRREVSISLLDARAGSPPTAVELMRRHCNNGKPTNIDQFLADWERWAAEILESHLSYPMLGLFRSQHENESWLAALTMVLDVSALMMATFDQKMAHGANLTFAIARHAAVDLSQVYESAPYVSKNDRLLSVALEQFQELLQDDSRVDTERLTELRALYEPYVNALSDALVMPLPNWTSDASLRDNWQTTAWKEVDGVSRNAPRP